MTTTQQLGKGFTPAGIALTVLVVAALVLSAFVGGTCF